MDFGFKFMKKKKVNKQKYVFILDFHFWKYGQGVEIFLL